MIRYLLVAIYALAAATIGTLVFTVQGVAGGLLSAAIAVSNRFVGEGVLVWGARTLDGNSLDWRYIKVRRTMIMLEESCRLAA